MLDEAIAEDTVLARVRPRREITGMSAVLLPYTADGEIEWPAIEAHIARTHAAGLTPAVNMDTGYVQLLDDATKSRVLDIATDVTSGRFVAGAHIVDEAGAVFDEAAYLSACDSIADRGATPVIFPSHGLNALDDAGWVQALERIGSHLDRFIGFELGSIFVPYGRIYSLDAYCGLLAISSCIGAKHSSLNRGLEWERLAMRDECRPEFMVLTGNDLAIDMVMFGSDYLLGLSTMAPSAFALRDRFWADGDSRFHELDDLLQYLGMLAFRTPVPAYRHDAALVFEMRGWSSSDRTPPGVPRREEWERTLLADVLDRLAPWEQEAAEHGLG